MRKGLISLEFGYNESRGKLEDQFGGSGNESDFVCIMKMKPIGFAHCLVHGSKKEKLER